MSEFLNSINSTKAPVCEAMEAVQRLRKAQIGSRTDLHFVGMLPMRRPRRFNWQGQLS